MIQGTHRLFYGWKMTQSFFFTSRCIETCFVVHSQATAQTPCQDTESFEDVRLAEGAFSEMSFDSPTVLKDAPRQHNAPDGSPSLGSVALESQAGGSDAGKPVTKVSDV